MRSVLCCLWRNFRTTLGPQVLKSTGLRSLGGARRPSCRVAQAFEARIPFVKVVLLILRLELLRVDHEVYVMKVPMLPTSEGLGCRVF